MKRAFTLLEIFIAMAILCLVGTVAGWGIKDMMDRSADIGQADEVYELFQTLQMASMGYGSVMRLEFKRNNNQFEITPITDETALKPVFRKKIKLAKNHHLKWNREQIQSQTFTFYPNGDVLPRGVLGFSERDYINLAQPIQIKRSKAYPEMITYNLLRPDEADQSSVQGG
jgi:prepilin-type N-terminal cleavage/methylation domain-containing protein